MPYREGMIDEAACLVCATLIPLEGSMPLAPGMRIGNRYFCTLDHYQQTVRQRIKTIDRALSAGS